MRRGKIILCCIILGVFSLLILFHWYLGTGETPFASTLRRWYFVKRFGHGRTYIPEVLSFEIPSFICGAAIGYFTFESGKIAKFFRIIVIAIVLVITVRLSREFYPELKSILTDLDSMGSFTAYFNHFFRAVIMGSFGAVIGWGRAKAKDEWLLN